MEELRQEFGELQRRWEADHQELQNLRAAQTALPPSPPPTFIVQRERKLRRYDGTTEPLLADWVEEARSCLQAQQLRGETAANFLLSYLDGSARAEMRCQPTDVRQDAEAVLTALQDVFGEKATANQLLRQFFFRRQLASEPIAAYSHALVELADRICRLTPKSAEERDLMLREQFIENVRDVLLRWELKRRIEADDSANFLALRKVAMLWAEEVEGAAQSKVRSQAVEASVERVEASVERVEAGPDGGEARARPAEPTGGEMGQLWAELAAQRRLLTEGLAEQGRVLSEVLEQQQQLSGPRAPLPPTPHFTSATYVPQQRLPATRRRLADLACYACGQLGHLRRDCRAHHASPPARLN